MFWTFAPKDAVPERLMIIRLRKAAGVPGPKNLMAQDSEFSPVTFPVRLRSLHMPRPAPSGEAHSRPTPPDGEASR